MRNIAEIKQSFAENGTSIAAWSVRHRFNPALVYAVLRQERKCLRGQSHEIAIALGLKAAPSLTLPGAP